jgi:hypothetical protein
MTTPVKIFSDRNPLAYFLTSLETSFLTQNLKPLGTPIEKRPDHVLVREFHFETRMWAPDRVVNDKNLGYIPEEEVAHLNPLDYGGQRYEIWKSRVQPFVGGA